MGSRAGQALDALTEQVGKRDEDTLVILRQMKADRFFTEAQRRRLSELMERWHAAQAGGAALSSEEQEELSALVQAEVEASGERAAAMARESVQSIPDCWNS